MKVIDTHTHLELLADLPAALERARQAGVAALVAMGRDERSGRFALEQASLHPGFIFPALGIHPYRLASRNLVARLERELAFIQDNLPRAVALGETGLDFLGQGLEATREHQLRVFRHLCRLGAEAGKPLLVHCWGAWDECLAILEEWGVRRACFHWCVAPPPVLERVLERGYLVSANPALFSEEEHRQVLCRTPLGRILLETDSPAEYNGDKYQPAYLVRVCRGLAELKGLDPQEVARATSANARAFLGLHPR